MTKIAQIKTVLKVKDMGHVKDYLGVQVTRKTGSLELSLPHLIDQLVTNVDIPKKVPSTVVPALSTQILHQGLLYPPHDENMFRYRSIIGILNYLEKTSRPDIPYAVHQLARFSSNPR